jgi:hypothetical protein
MLLWRLQLRNRLRNQLEYPHGKLEWPELLRTRIWSGFGCHDLDRHKVCLAPGGHGFLRFGLWIQ